MDETFDEDLVSVLAYCREYKCITKRTKLCPALCCPGLGLGYLRSKVLRERLWCRPNQNCCGYTCGNSGSLYCLMGTFLCFTPPALGCYLCMQRRYLKWIYEREYLDFEDACCSIFLWPFTLAQHIEYLERKEHDGLLRHTWEPTGVDDLAPPRVLERRVFIIGPKGTGKTYLFERLLMCASGKEHEGGAEEVRVGARPISVNKSDVSFLEIWDVPTAKIHMIDINEADTVLLLYDMSTTASFDDLVALADPLLGKISDALHDTGTTGHVVGTRDDRYPEDEAMKEKITERASVWASEHGMYYHSLSSKSNRLVTELKDFLVEHVFPDQMPQGSPESKRSSV